MPHLILASTSPYRRQLLERLGLQVDVYDPSVDESAKPGEKASKLAIRLANAKADNMAEEIVDADSIIIGADQVAELDGELLRKPGEKHTALHQLMTCQKKVVSFHTACTVIDYRSKCRWEGIDHTKVKFLRLGERRLKRYIELEKPFDCAGGFKAEGLGIALFDSIESADPTALLGLPLIWLSAILREIGVDPLGPVNGD